MSNENTANESGRDDREYLRQVNALTVAIAGAIPDGTDFPLVIGACMTMLEHCVRQCEPDKRKFVINTLRSSIDAIAANLAPEVAPQAGRAN